MKLIKKLDPLPKAEGPELFSISRKSVHKVDALNISNTEKILLFSATFKVGVII